RPDHQRYRHGQIPGYLKLRFLDGNARTWNACRRKQNHIHRLRHRSISHHQGAHFPKSPMAHRQSEKLTPDRLDPVPKPASWWSWFYHVFRRHPARVYLAEHDQPGTADLKYKADLHSAYIRLHQYHASWHCRRSPDPDEAVNDCDHNPALK